MWPLACLNAPVPAPPLLNKRTVATAGPGGFTDQWLRFAPAEDGSTSGLSELVNDTPEQAAARFDHRIDLVLARGADGEPLPVDRGWVVGRDPAERTPATAIGRLWPSDHAGVILRLRP